jgi:regulator of sigma E protease
MAHVLLAILGLSLLVTIHEAGHYVMARASGMRVLCFSIGFGPALVKFRPKGSPTVFQICVLPFLAYVRVAGASPADESDPSDPGLYENKSVMARALMVVGGPLANYLTASLMIFALAMTGWREDVPASPMVVAAVAPGSPAEAAGVRAGDAIVAVDGEAIDGVDALTARTTGRAGRPTAYALRRDGKAIDPVTIVPRDAGGRGVIGVTPKVESRTRRRSLGESAALAITLPAVMTLENLKGIADLVRRRSTEGLTGPVGMVKQVATEANEGFYPFVSILIALSVALGYFNLLPFPFLDGGRLVFLGYEMITARRASPRIEAMAHAVGVLFLLGMTALVTWRDVVG